MILQTTENHTNLHVWNSHRQHAAGLSGQRNTIDSFSAIADFLVKTCTRYVSMPFVRNSH